MNGVCCLLKRTGAKGSHLFQCPILQIHTESQADKFCHPQVKSRQTFWHPQDTSSKVLAFSGRNIIEPCYDIKHLSSVDIFALRCSHMGTTARQAKRHSYLHTRAPAVTVPS